MTKRNTQDRRRPVLSDSQGRPIYGTLAGEASETIVRLVNFWRSKGIGVCALKAGANAPLTIEAINYSAMRAASYIGGRREWEQAVERRSQAASKPRKEAERATLRARAEEVKRTTRARLSEERIAEKLKVSRKTLRRALGKSV